MSGSYFLGVLFCRNMDFSFRKSRFSRRIWPGWGNTACADMAGLGSITLGVNLNTMCTTNQKR